MPSLWKENKNRERRISMDNTPGKDKIKKDITFCDLYNAFLVYRRIFERFDNGTYNDASDIIGEVLIKSLICEIGMKALLMNEGKNIIREHKLDNLFIKLSDETKLEMVKRSHYALDEFQVLLSINSDHFVGWRYFYEGHCEKFHPNFIDRLIKALEEKLKDISNNIKP